MSAVSIHAPWEGCDQLVGVPDHRKQRFQFTHPGKGATRVTECIKCLLFSFNSRTLGRVRLAVLLFLLILDAFQFTHPGKGATTDCFRSSYLRRFNSRTLGRVRRSVLSEPSKRIEFQFTHPGKGATIIIGSNCTTKIVSIHAPWEGCDLISPRLLLLPSRFQFTHPGKGATIYYIITQDQQVVSIHAPWEGCDDLLEVYELGDDVSIHAPWEGCDEVFLYLIFTKRRFNSRTLGRVRRATTSLLEVNLTFQFTHPGKGATTPPSPRS